MEAKKYICYYRVSTKKQGKSGLGLDAQRTICENYVENQKGIIVNSFVEVESGKNDNREQLHTAIAECKQTNSTLLIAKLDRLSRSVEFIFSLKNSGVNFVCVDMPELTTMTLGIFSTFAQSERERISERITVALAEKKKKGIKLGKPENLSNNFEKAYTNSLATRQNNAMNNENNRKAGLLVVSLRQSGKTWNEITTTLNKNGFRTRRGCMFGMTQVVRLYERFS
ncbi:recombinase family protein [Dysgonomonas macrotermitis]|uniref:Resolvase, N terminal domain n=1 Tax=Dysgonomonas macrotermitis TaxID=1346286 RepID=A0A1M5DCM4_9BACT|nr:recombinase family protein [Dysgonomonas macrotermitis]SHF64717.1 Resolvase, N terminal domain [Dysgonomonas macrotermitis]